MTALHRADAGAGGRTRARFRNLIERSSDLIVLLDAAGQVTFWSPSASHVAGPGQEGCSGNASSTESGSTTIGFHGRHRQAAQATDDERADRVRAQRKRASWRPAWRGCAGTSLGDPAVGAVT